MKCNTPIDPETKTALSGAALEAALKDPNSPRCGYELSVDDVFCPTCGAKVERQAVNAGFDSNGEPALLLERIKLPSWKRTLFRVGYVVGAIASTAAFVGVLVLICTGNTENFRMYGFGFLITFLFFAIRLWLLVFGDDADRDLSRAGNGDPVGLFNIGVALYKGEAKVEKPDHSVVEGESGAFDYFMSAAMKGNGQGMFNVACCSETGVGCVRDKSRALAWYRKAAENGIVEAARHVARLEKEMSV